MSGFVPSPSVQARSDPHGWHVRFRPAGPAGALTARLPHSLVLCLDTAEPWIALELNCADTDEPELPSALISVLFGMDAGRVARDGANGVAAYEPDGSPSGRRLRRLLIQLARQGGRADLGALAVAAAAEQLHHQYAAVAPTGPLTKLAGSIAVAWAARGVTSLRILPDRHELCLDPAAEDVLDQALALVRRLIGPDVELGPIGAQPPLPVIDDNLLVEMAEELSLLSRRDESLVRLRSDPADRRAGARLVATDFCPLPVQIDQVWVTELSAGELLVEGDVGYLAVDEAGQAVALERPPEPPAAPEVWIRAIRRSDRCVLYASRAVLAGAQLSGRLFVPLELTERDYWVELAAGPDVEVTTRRQANSRQAQRSGAQAARIAARARDGQQWASAGGLWLNCAALWREVEDFDRYTLALLHAARAFLAGGPSWSASAVAAARDAARFVSGLDAGWLAPSAAERAVADVLAEDVLIDLSRLGRPVAEWVGRELAQATQESVPALQVGYLRRLLVELPEVVEYDRERMLLLRARARVALAYQASLDPNTLSLASVMMATASSEWAYLDEAGRNRFSAVNLTLLDALLAPG